MSKKYPIKLVYDFDEDEYVVYIDGIADIEGRGTTEQEAIDDFNSNYEIIFK